MSWTRRCLPIAVVGVGALAPSAQAATWTEVPSNTAEDITAIEYQGPERFWFATGAGKIFRRVGGVFAQKASLPGTVFKDIEFQDGGQVGFAVGTNGTVARSPDGGDSWAAVPGLVGGHPTGANDCSGAGQGIGDVDSRYKKLVRVRRSRIGKLRSLRLKVAFKGNAAVAASSVTYTVPVR